MNLVIEFEDLMRASQILRSGLPEFHNQRLFSLLLSEEQKQPDSKVGYKNGFFVISKIDILDKAKLP